MIVHVLDNRANEDHFGLIPMFLDEDNPAKAVEQLDANYQHGGGWFPMKNFTMSKDKVLQYPGDPPLQPLGYMQLRDERIYVYQYGIVAVVQPDGSFEAARMD